MSLLFVRSAFEYKVGDDMYKSFHFSDLFLKKDTNLYLLLLFILFFSLFKAYFERREKVSNDLEAYKRTREQDKEATKRSLILFLFFCEKKKRFM